MATAPVTGIRDSHRDSEQEDVVRRRAIQKCQFVLETLYDSYNGFKQCASDCKDTALKSIFQSIAVSRSDFISHLSNAIRVDLGVEPVTSGSVIGAAHRTWIDVKTWFTDGRDISAIITEVHRGENVLIQLYESAVNDTNILLKVRNLLGEQLAKIKEQDQALPSDTH